MSQSNTKLEVDHSRGRAFISEGVLFYSPNSARRVAVPTHRNDSYRFRKHDARLELFRTPEWWTRAYGYLGFVALLPSFNGAAFGCLREFVSSIEEKYLLTHEEYAMDSGKVEEWLELETGLMQITSLLGKKFLFRGALHPIAPSLLGFPATFRTRRAAVSSILASRDWFVIWMGLLSFIIAQIEFVKLNHAIPDWFQYLVDKGISQMWLSGLHQSGLCNFAVSSFRVGVFIDWLQKDTSTPPLELFTAFNVPVWYPWTTELGDLVARTPALANLQPLPEHLQAATTFIFRQPKTYSQLIGYPMSNFSSLATRSEAPVQYLPSQDPYTPQAQYPQSPPQSAQSPAQPPAAVDMTHAELMAARLAYARTKPWLAFFQAREARNLEKAAKETPQARQTRLNRERKPPQNKVPVFVWDWSDEDPLQLVRTRIPTNKECKDALESHRESQSIYNSWSNEWDLCDYFGEEDYDSDEEDSTYQDGFDAPNDPGDSEVAHQAYIADRLQGPVSFLSSSEPVLPVDDAGPSEVNTSFDILDHLCTHYGFVCPLSPQTQAIDDNAWDLCMKAIGHVAGPNNPPLPDFQGSIIHFINALQSPDGPSSHNFDVFPDNCVTIKTDRLFRDIIRLDNFFLVQPTAFQPNPFHWTIAISDIPQALFVFRLLRKHRLTPASLAHILLKEGVAFRTVQPLADVHIKSSLCDIVTMVPIRLSDYVFKPSDYEVYVHQRAMILSSPRGRAALLWGRIIGCLAKEHLALESACLGPSFSVTVHCIGFNITIDDIKYWDDQLTDTEIDVICGLHRCYTGMQHIESLTGI